MQNKKWLAAVAVGLGVLAGAAQAAPSMRVTINGTLLDASLSNDQGPESVWQLPTNNGQYYSGYDLRNYYYSHPHTSRDVQITLDFESATFNSATTYSPTSTAHYYGTSVDKSTINLPGIVKASVTFNQVTRSVTSTAGWTLNETSVGSDAKTDTWSLTIVESTTSGNYRGIGLGGGTGSGIYFPDTSSFANNSNSALRQLMLGKTVSFDQNISGELKFNYQVAGKYDSQLRITPNSISIAPVPEPETWAMMAAGLGLVGFAARRRSR